MYAFGLLYPWKLRKKSNKKEGTRKREREEIRYTKRTYIANVKMNTVRFITSKINAVEWDLRN